MTRVNPPRSQRLTIVAGEAERAEHAEMNSFIRGAAGLVPDDATPAAPTGVNRELRAGLTEANPALRLKYKATSLVGRQQAALSRLFKHVPKSKKEEP
jgi:hypothetical protein